MTYQGQERRLTTDGSPPGDNNGRWEWLHTVLMSLSAKVDAQHMSIIDVTQKVAKVDKDLNDHVMEEMHAYKQVMDGFPDGDPKAHRTYHVQLMIESERRIKFWIDMRTELGKHTLRGLLIVLLALVVYYWNGHVPTVAEVHSHIVKP